MADYWKSQARKYCDFCKCWIADNKPSVEFHEKGRRHKENVAKRLKFITKKSARDEQQNVKVDQAIAQMEAAGLEAYRRDVENNADLTSVNINKKLADENLAIAVKNNTVWREAKSESGQVYYWNIATNESVWTAPSEGYMSLKEQENEVSQRQWKEFNKKQILQTRLRIQDETLQKQEEMAAAAREKMKERRVEEMPPVIAAPLLEEGKNDPYGKWSVVQRIEVEEEPEVKDEENTEENVEEVLVEAEPVKVFKEKTVESLGSESNVQFKKRRFKNNAGRNARTRLDDD